MKFDRAIFGPFLMFALLGVEVVLAGFPREDLAGLGHLQPLSI